MGVGLEPRISGRANLVQIQLVNFSLFKPNLFKQITQSVSLVCHYLIRTSPNKVMTKQWSNYQNILNKCLFQCPSFYEFALNFKSTFTVLKFFISAGIALVLKYARNVLKYFNNVNKQKCTDVTFIQILAYEVKSPN